MKTLVLSLLLGGLLALASCGGEAQIAPPYEKSNRIIAVESQPSSLRDFALVSNGNIHIGSKLMTSGPLADVHANGTIKARALSMDISGKITAKTQYNNTGIMPKRSFDYKSLKSSASHVNFRALKVDEFLNSTIMGEHYVLTSTGEAVVRANGLADQPAEIPNIDFSFNGINKQWTITTTAGQLNLPLVAETNLNIDAQVLSVYGTLMVQGALHAL